MTPRGNPYERVVFRVWKEGDVIALWPDSLDRGGIGKVMSYERVGQHGGADYAGVIAATRPATPDEYAPLYAELTGPIGYDPMRVVRRARTQRLEWPAPADEYPPYPCPDDPDGLHHVGCGCDF